MDKIKVLIVDDHALVRRGLSEILGDADSIELLGEARDGEEGVEVASILKPDVVMMDLHIPICDGAEATRRLQRELPECKVLILTVSENEDDLLNAIKAGARGYMLKNEAPDVLIQAVQYVARGGIIASPEMAKKLTKGSSKDASDGKAVAAGRDADDGQALTGVLGGGERGGASHGEPEGAGTEAEAAEGTPESAAVAAAPQTTP